MEGKESMTSCTISVIIPVYREEERINTALDSLLNLPDMRETEIIVSDGHPQATTIAAIKERYRNLEKVVAVRSEKGRGVQMNTGAGHAKGELLLFLHADTVMDDVAWKLLRAACGRSAELGCGAFDLKIDSTKTVFRIIEKVASLRSRMTRLPYGDQGIFIKRDWFDRVSGYPDWPLMEDVGLMRKIRQNHVRPVILRHAVKTSARRWESQGIIYTTVCNWILLLLFFAGVPPYRLARFY
ncbi:MAG: TIGR04283 family arsenosugar biosynthesis glycosyltransferase [Desulfarculaceae bacterium]|nr:TIGR04283 family arsenosugar biosynthesis glycosyltransferase [Desulfarculaceae bacterium]